MEVKEIKKKLKKSLDKQRYQHTLGVMYTAGCLAMANGYSDRKGNACRPAS
jgi:HD superfamily phosphohydrolase YqeK